MLFRFFSYLFGVLFCCAAFLLGILFFFLIYPTIDVASLQNDIQSRPSIVLDDEGNELTRFQIERCDPVQFSAIPEHVIHAFLAAEDRSFFHHAGISFRGIIRSLFVNLYQAKRAQGASTITQQLVRLLYFDASKTFVRKIKEQVVAILLERQLSKHQIMELYLNHVYFGCGIYGIGAAAKRFWGKTVEQVTIDQAAVLAAIMKSPQNYCPLLFPLSCQQRRNIVLNSMMQCKFITFEEYKDAMQKQLAIVDHSIMIAPHAKEWIRYFVEKEFGRDKLYRGGLVIQTTLNSAMQKDAIEEFKKQIVHLREKMMPEIDGALICTEVKSGEIKALIGGYDFSISQFDRAHCAFRQFGSIFKPIVYAAAVENGVQFFETEIDEPFEMVQENSVWKPDNFSNTFDGQMTLAYALSHSNNIVTIKTLLKIGVQKVVDVAQRFNFSARIVPYPSLALGCVDGTLKEAVGMFNVFANNGIYVEPHLIRWIKDGMGTKIWKMKIEQRRVFNSRVSDQVAKILSLSFDRLQKRFPQLLECAAIGKTGTHDKCRSCWHIGSTPTYTTGVYIGCDDNRSLGRNIFGAKTAFPLWLNVQQKLPIVKKQFAIDPSLREITVHERTGKPCAKDDANAITIFIDQGRF
ncbi:MAG: Penicillin-binding protein 1F [Candidatus Dependentiae bacterium ADurb.Bin331]|nr:MAG: Penicillin-binding protein 1F [Candidatus Dependentiae bacterium ADurb.Bin331]